MSNTSTSSPDIFDSNIIGPIHSRRLGVSLGVNLLPKDGKICSFDCIYCECGWNSDGRSDTRIPSAEDLSKALDAKLRECLEQGTEIDSITFSGDGEPTLNPEFPAMVDCVTALRDRYYPQARVSVLTNATRIVRPEVLAALCKVDSPMLKIDAPTLAGVQAINRPQGEYDLESILKAMESLDGDFILQTMMLRSELFDSSQPEVLDGWMDIVRRVHPREVMVYTVDRPAPQKGLEKFTVEQMAAMVAPLIEEGFNIKIYG